MFFTSESTLSLNSIQLRLLWVHYYTILHKILKSLMFKPFFKIQLYLFYVVVVKRYHIGELLSIIIDILIGASHKWI